MKDRIFVYGAGGLSLGFFGPELYPEYDMTFVDTHFKADLVASIQKRGEYTTNVAGEKIVPVTVPNVSAFRLDIPEQDEAIREHISHARIFYTAVGIRNLDSALTHLTERLNGRTEDIYILCAENGEGIAERWRTKVPANVHLLDTVMGRMCRLEDVAAPDYAQVEPDIKWGVVGEDLKDMPLSNEFANPKVFHSKAFLFVSPKEFHARERIKLYAHNGLHFFAAALGSLKGAQRFNELTDDIAIVESIWKLMLEEIAPALWKDCGKHVGKKHFEAYMQKLPCRLMSGTLRDHVARGVRGIVDKFAPNERVMGGLRMLHANGIKPNRYYDLIGAGLAVAERDVSREAAMKILASIEDSQDRNEIEKRWKAQKSS